MNIGTSYPVKYRNPKRGKAAAKHLTEYVDEFEVWNEWDPYVSDLWGWDVDPESGKYFDEVGPKTWTGTKTWNGHYPPIYSGNHVKHALDSMVIFDSSHVVP